MAHRICSSAQEPPPVWPSASGPEELDDTLRA
jgi:hypothetical protein